MARECRIEFYSKEDKLISFSEIDVEVCEFWNVAIHEKKWAEPQGRESDNGIWSWYERIFNFLFLSPIDIDSGKRKMDELIDVVFALSEDSPKKFKSFYE